MGEFFKAQGLDLNKKTGRIESKENDKRLEIERAKELEKMGYGPNGEILDKKKINYDPINDKDYSYSAQYKKFEKKHEELYPNQKAEGRTDRFDNISSFYDEQDDLQIEKENQKYLDNFENKESLNNFIKTYEDLSEEEGQGFENEDILANSIKKTIEKDRKSEIKNKKDEENLSDYSDFEIEEFKKTLTNHLDKKPAKFSNGDEMNEKQKMEMIDELKNNLPEEFVKLINRRLISENFKWEKETFKNENFIVSYFPDKKNPSIKYILKAENDLDLEGMKKVFVNSSLKSNKELIKDGNGCLLVFCSPPLGYKNRDIKQNKQFKRSERV